MPDPIPAASSEVAVVPEPLLRGRFAVYKHTSGSLVIGVRLGDDETTRHFVIPRAMFKLMNSMPGLPKLKDPVKMLEDLAAERNSPNPPGDG